jgi:hypothetical protein
VRKFFGKKTGWIEDGDADVGEDKDEEDEWELANFCIAA